MNNSGKSILMLGGSRQQVVAIRRAKELGFRTVLCDYLPDNPGQFVADVFYQESTTDREKMLEVARKENVFGVLAYSSDPASPTAGYVAEVMGLPQILLRPLKRCPRSICFVNSSNKQGFLVLRQCLFL